MNRLTLTIVGFTAAACIALFLIREGRNRDLVEQVETRKQSVVRLEHRAESPGADDRAALSALKSNTPLPGTIEAAVAEARANSTPEERIDRAVQRIEALVADIGDLDQSPAELFKVLPDLLRMIQDLDLDEMVAVADKLDAPLSMGKTDGKGAMKMIIMMLAADQDPIKILSHPEITDNRELRGTVLSALVREDPQAAREWIENSDLSKQEVKEMEQMITYNTLRNDFAAGLEMIREAGDSEALQMLGMMGQFGLRESTVPQIIDAIADPANEELKPQLLNLVMGAAANQGGIPAVRERAMELEMTDEEVGDYLTQNLYSLVRTDAAASFDWLMEVSDEEQLAETVPNAISSWAHQDFNAAGEWLGTMEPSPVKDATIVEYSRVITAVDPRAATIWAAQIEDESIRQDALSNAHRSWVQQDSDAAAAWLEASGISLP